MIDPITQFYAGVVMFGSTALPTRASATYEADENWVVPEVVGNTGAYNVGDGAISATMSASILLRDKVGEALSSTFLNLFLTRTAFPAHTTNAVTGGFTFWDGRDGGNYATAKADSFTISGSMGDLVNFNTRWCGQGNETTVTTSPMTLAWDNSGLLTFDDISFGGALAQRVERFSLTYSNNHIPDGSFVGSRFPQAWHPGQWTSSLQLTMKASARSVIPADGTSISFTITGANGAATFTVPNPLMNNRRSRSLTAPHNKRNYSLRCMTPDGIACPISVTSTY